ncbi:MAG: hypothetical protein GY839_17370 [candidate division Zixibacteria bacterium]|nr:hypothetical protein [candidate division Zixibacteria bacterium]
MKSVNYFLIAAMVFSLTAFASADVIVKQQTSSDMMGMMKINVDGTEYIKGDKSCNMSKMKMGGGMAGMMGDAGGTDVYEITRVDMGVKWNLDSRTKAYTETNLSAIKDMMGGDKSYEQGGPGMGMGDEAEYDWTVEVTSSDDEVDINGFKCKNLTGKATGVGVKNPDEKMQLTFEYWYAVDVPGKDELTSYYKSMASATGTEMMTNQKGAEAFYGMYGDQFGEMFKKLDESGGYPIKTVILVEGNQDKGGMGGGNANLDDENIPAGMKDMLSGMMGKKDDQGGLKTMFSVTNEVTSIEETAIDDSQFEIPEGYSKGQ